MDAHDGSTLELLSERLAREPHRFGFFQALGLLERALASTSGVDLATTAAFDRYVRVRPSRSLAVPASDVVACKAELVDVDEPPRHTFTVTFLGLYGVDSPLPDYYLDRIAQDEDEESARRRFLDVFHQRLYRLLYDGFKKYRYPLHLRADGSDPISHRLLALIGVGAQARPRQRVSTASFGVSPSAEPTGTAPTTGDREPPPMPSHTLGLLAFMESTARGECSQAVLAQILRAALGVRVAIEHYVFRWESIPEQQRLRVGRRGCRLGVDATLGARVGTRDTCFAIEVKDVDQSQFESLLPGGWRYQRIGELVRMLLRRPLSWELRLHVNPEANKAATLGGGSGAQLGRWSWLQANPVGQVQSTIAVQGDATC
ncbi:MAG: type VI secretion system baseplate subunit TssG [Pseudomonadota bacterium]